MEEVTRPVYRSDFNYTNYAGRAQLRVGLGLWLIRELPIKNFYTRCGIDLNDVIEDTSSK